MGLVGAGPAPMLHLKREYHYALALSAGTNVSFLELRPKNS